MMRVGAVLVGLSLTLLLSVGRSAAQPVGSAFQVNTFTPGVQGAPAVAAAPGTGDFVIVWESFDQDGDYIGVFGQRYAASGAKQGGEFPANAYTPGPQSAPDVSVGGDGSFVVVWQGYGEGSDYGDVFARRFAKDGTPQGDEFQVNEPVAGSYEGAAAVAETASGFVIVWDDYEDVFARRFDGTGAPLGDSFQVNTATLGFQGSADVAATADGGFVIAWEDGYFDAPGEDGDGYGVFARRYDAAGNAAGMPFQVNTTTVGDQYSVSLGAPPGGGFVVVWQSYDVDVPDDSVVFGQRFDGGGAPQGGEFRVNAAPSEAAARRPAPPRPAPRTRPPPPPPRPRLPPPPGARPAPPAAATATATAWWRSTSWSARSASPSTTARRLAARRSTSPATATSPSTT
ncbi:MAG TPA: hypothetical protein VL049_24475 [Candidatus Dormibacteraeota bacterium]|nr:hypothetical protein [Candidatus Dormibacteraeota bacterium]